MRLKQVYILRHGETEWTLSKKHTGLTDIPLTKNGQKEAKLLGKSLRKLKFDHVFCSPLLRAKETCQIAGLDEFVFYDSDLVEWNYGDYEGKTSTEIHQENPDWTVFSQDPPNGERAQEVGARADRVIQKLLGLDGNVAIVSSGHFSRVLGARWMGLPVSAGENLLLSTASKSILTFSHGYQAIKTWNDTSYLS